MSKERIEITRKDDGYWHAAIYATFGDCRLLTAFNLKPEFSYQNAYNYMKKFLWFPEEFDDLGQEDRVPSPYDD